MNVRLSVMQKYLELKLDLKKDAFQKICKNYFHFQHRPLVDMEKSFLIATEIIQYPNEKILSYPFVIAVDPTNTLKIINDPNSFGGLNVLEQLRKFPNILRAKYTSIIEINKILNVCTFFNNFYIKIAFVQFFMFVFQEFQIPLSVLKKSSFIYLLKPDTIRIRLLECKKNETFDAFSKNPRVRMIVTKLTICLYTIELDKNTKLIFYHIIFITFSFYYLFFIKREPKNG